MDFDKSAAANFERHLVQNSYPGRVLVIGRADDGSWLQLYAIMGRSDQSRNRRFVADGPTLRTESGTREAKPSKFSPNILTSLRACSS